jgi:hypothetical protein
MSVSDALAQLPSAAWAFLSSLATALGGWFVATRSIRAAIEREHEKTSADQMTSGLSDQAKFRQSLLETISDLRNRLAGCETDRDVLRARIAGLEEELAVQQASVEIMRRWIAFFRSQGLANLPEIPAIVMPPKQGHGR